MTSSLLVAAGSPVENRLEVAEQWPLTAGIAVRASSALQLSHARSDRRRAAIKHLRDPASALHHSSFHISQIRIDLQHPAIIFCIAAKCGLGGAPGQ